ncbi:response regulator transcription factor [Alkalinema sp. FACHB-956]|uniref:response regulator transcription factor n=1 Tax=Alkalinema sp. FACHB-956 TaxID=2692768 RepID=UPI001F54D740|nr:response regulator transcription factor [Alkalinema sp. FACHB-956]
MIRLFLVDDQTLIRRGLRALLKPEPDLEVIGEADNGEAAIGQLATLQPDVVLMDVRMPVMDGVAATREICQHFPQVKVLILTTFDDTDYVTQALQHGASGYLLKDTPVEELVQAIHLVAKGYTQLAPGLAQKILMSSGLSSAGLSQSPAHESSLHDNSLKTISYEKVPSELDNPHSSQSAISHPTNLAWDKPWDGTIEGTELLESLTPREREILQWIAQGASNREIAQQLYISEKTVKNHVTNILSRLGLRDRTQAAIFVHSLSKNEFKE